MLRRRHARASLTEWCRECGYEPARHHKLIVKELEAVARGETDRLMLFLPPGSAKSTYGSVLFPPWYLSQGEHAFAAAGIKPGLVDHTAPLRRGFFFGLSPT